ncbi:hypothetical protein TNCV_4786501 [Trichonephila clavipes]|nr:hypothetical protein TNCV_4786501 [Trichonephila clavipes]
MLGTNAEEEKVVVTGVLKLFEYKSGWQTNGVGNRSDRMLTGRETVLVSSFYSQYGLSTISGLPLHDDKGRYRPEKSMTDSPKDLSQLVAIYFVVLQCNPWPSLFR